MPDPKVLPDSGKHNILASAVMPDAEVLPDSDKHNILTSAVKTDECPILLSSWGPNKSRKRKYKNVSENDSDDDSIMDATILTRRKKTARQMFFR